MGYLHGNGTLKNELHHTAERLIWITENQGIYFAIAFLYDSSYTMEHIKMLLPILQEKDGAIKKKNGRIVHPDLSI